MGWLRAGVVGLVLVGCASAERANRGPEGSEAPDDAAPVPPTAVFGQDVDAVVPELPDVIDLALLGIHRASGVAVDGFDGRIYVVEGHGVVHEVDRLGQWASWATAEIPGRPWVRDLTWAHGQGTHLFLLTDVGGFRWDPAQLDPPEEWFCLEPEDEGLYDEGVLDPTLCQAGGAVAFRGSGTRELFTVHQVIDCVQPTVIYESHVEIYDVDTGVIEEIWQGTVPLAAVGAVSLQDLAGGAFGRTWLVAEPDGFVAVTLDVPPYRPQPDPLGLPTDFVRIAGVALAADGDGLWVLDGGANELRYVAF